MGFIFARLSDMLFLRSGPQDLPPGWSLAVLLTTAYVIQGFVADSLLNETSAARSMMSIGLQFLVVAFLLNLMNFRERLPQTLSALAGVGLIFGFAAIALISAATPGQSHPLLALMWFGVFLWSLAVDAHIYRHAMAISMSTGVLIAVLIFAANFLLIQSIFR